jgi:hypothetical protein
MPESEQAIAPKWTDAQIEAERKAYAQKKKKTTENPVAKEMFKGTDFEDGPKQISAENVEACPFNEGSSSAADGDAQHKISSSDSNKRPMSNSTSIGVKSFVSGFSIKADSTFEEAGLHRPCKIPSIH